MEPMQLEPGLPFVGSLLWPVMQYRKLNKLTWWQVGRKTIPTIPTGSVVGLRQVRRRRDLRPGVYVMVHNWPHGESTVFLFRWVAGRKQGRGWIEAEREDGHTFSCVLWWQSMTLWRIECYASVGNGTYTPAPKERKRKPTPQQRERQIEEIETFEGAAVRLSYEGCGQPRKTFLVPIEAMGPILDCVIDALRGKVKQGEKRIARNETRIANKAGKQLLSEARQLVAGKGGQKK